MATIIGAGIVAGGAVYGARQSRKAAEKMYKGNKQLYGSGMTLSDSAVADTRRLGDAYEQSLKSGASVLPSSTTSVLKRARGAIADRSVRDTQASAARLRQARIAGGGRLSAEAAQEYLTEAEAEANRAEQEAGLSLDTQEAQLELGETNNLRDRLERARAQLLGEGRARWSAGLGGANAALQQQGASDMQLAQILAQFGTTVYNSNNPNPTPRLGQP